MASMIKSFAGVNSPAFLIVEKVNASVLPQSQISQIDVPMRSGSYFVNKKHGVRTFTVEFAIKSPEKNQVMYYMDDLAEWLNHSEPKELIFRDKPDVTYYAMVDSSVDIAKFGNSGRGSIVFVCFDPHGYGAERTYAFNPINDEPIQIVNGGNTSTAPLMRMEFTQNVTDFAIVTDNDMLYFGNPFDVSAKTPTDLNNRLHQDHHTTTTGWTSGLAVDGGIVTGQMYSDGSKFKQFEGNYGTHAQWHGGAMMKSLNKEIQDFALQTTIDFKSTGANQMGRVELYLLDVNNNHIGKIGLVDASPTTKAVRFEARAGTRNDGKYLASHHAWVPAGFDNFYGILRLTRKGNLWTAYVAKVDKVSGRHHTSMTKTWRDTANVWTAKKLAAIQVHVGAYGTRVPTNLLTLDNSWVTEHINPTANQIGYIFEAGDILEINNNTGEILRNGEPYFENLYPSSTFIKFDKGLNGISVSLPVIMNGEIKFQERWL